MTFTNLHTASIEGYIVQSGTGILQTLSGAGYEEHPLSPGTVLWFTPGTIHRVNTSSPADLDIPVVMQNAGLPEAGDAVFTFPPSRPRVPCFVRRSRRARPAIRLGGPPPPRPRRVRLPRAALRWHPGVGRLLRSSGSDRRAPESPSGAAYGRNEHCPPLLPRVTS
jgi:hypothetical protein